jgi:hypothetical protein
MTAVGRKVDRTTEQLAQLLCETVDPGSETRAGRKHVQHVDCNASCVVALRESCAPGGSPPPARSREMTSE